MALDASIGNRAKETFDLGVEYSSIYKTNDESEIRNLLSLECCIVDWFETLKTNQKEKIKKDLGIFLKLSNKELAEERNNRSEVLKDMFKPTFELLNYNIASDNSIGAFIVNNKDKITENVILKIPEDKDLHSYVDILIDMFSEQNNKETKNNKYLAKLKKEIDILGQVEIKENLNKKLNK